MWPYVWCCPALRETALGGARVELEHLGALAVGALIGSGGQTTGPECAYEPAAQGDCVA